MLPRDLSGDELVRLLNRRYGYRVIHQRSSLMRLLTDIRGHKHRVSVPRHSQLVERETLERWVRRPRTAQALAQRARMVLACAESRSNTAVAADLGVSDETVGKWRARFVERRLDGLSDESRSGRPRGVTDEDPKPFVRAKTADRILANVAHFCQRTLDT